MDVLDELLVISTVAFFTAAVVLYHAEGGLQIGGSPRIYRPPGLPTTLHDRDAGARITRVFLEGNPKWCYKQLRIKQAVLKQLIAKLEEYGLKGGYRISTAEQVVIYLEHVAHRRPHDSLAFAYQHSSKSISLAIRTVNKLLCRMYSEYVRLPDESLQTAPEVLKDRKVGRYFRGCIGALDGSHIPLRTRGTDTDVWRNRKGFVSQNVLAACDFDMRFLYVLPGYEGSANDGTVLNRALKKRLKVPDGRYYLADGGYSKNLACILVPYPKTRYHLREFRESKHRPKTKEELFNLRHAQWRNAIERLFGVTKMRWPILDTGPSRGYSVRRQAQFIIALSVLHNFMKDHGQDPRKELMAFGWKPPNEELSFSEAAGTAPSRDAEMESYRDQVATAMWDDYLLLLEMRGQLVDEDESDSEVDEMDEDFED